MNEPQADGTTVCRELTEPERQMIVQLRAATRTEVVVCAFCEIESPDNLEAAVARGWTRIQIDDGASWNYLGVCPGCLRNVID